MTNKDKNNWTVGQIAMAMDLRFNHGLAWKEVKRVMESEGSPVRSTENYSSTISRYIKKYNLKVKGNDEKKDWETDPATRKQCSYIASMSLPNGTREEIKKLTQELVDASKRGEFNKETANQQIRLLEQATNVKPVSIKRKTKPKTYRGGHNHKWTAKEDNQLVAWINENQYGEQGFPPNMNRTNRALVERWRRCLIQLTPNVKGVSKNGNYTLINDEEPPKTVKTEEVIKKVIEEPKQTFTRLNNESIQYPNTHKAWTYAESLEAMVMWHNLSIDGAREKFGRPYWVIAKHVEKHYDFTYAESKSLLMEATAMKNRMKANKEAEKKTSLLKRWKAKRNAKKQKRLEKKMAKAQRKLKKMGVEIDG